MGGEPTFVSIDDMDGAEWNFTAVGPDKKRLSGQLLRRLRDVFAPNGLLHHGQGKWYPGESLPRWSYGCWWRRDGQPIWHDPSLLADIESNLSHTGTEAKRFIEALTETLGLPDKHIIPAFEDVFYYLWRERRLPGNVDPLKSNLEDEEERVRLAKVYTDGLDHIVGYALPLRRTEAGEWVTGGWFLRREHLFLIPGDSPMGLRLPLDSLPWVKEEDYPFLPLLDPLDITGPLPPAFAPGVKFPDPATFPEPAATVPAGGSEESLSAVQAARQAFLLRSAESGSTVNPADGLSVGDILRREWEKRESETMADRVPGPQESADWITRTALCVEPRDGKLHIFLPPMRTTEDYLDLVSAVESVAARLGMPVVLEGTPPPFDVRLQNFKVTPDPGVIEVNMQPAFSWDELVFNTTTLYDEARLTRLGAEKFMMDGRHVGTGGGNHIVIGGNTPADSPLLRRPDLLRSLVTFWQNHPSLSFLFSGLFIGPTSQHPRIDEARNDALYEMEIAFSQVPEGEAATPWLVDRVFRNLLTDLTGNTHRAEFCIDKLYSPEGAAGRLGLLELRAFEMPPHAQMSLAQHLLLRALLAKFWKTPCHRKLVRWGTELHDRFMLPHFVRQDLEDVITDLRDSGYPLEAEWFAPHLEFRFPLFGEIAHRGVHVEVRQALEPWHVLGEQGTAGGAARYVDSSLERLQVKVTGLVDSRHVVTVNGKTLPLHPTGNAGEYVAGVRFRAWAPPECLHPTIGVHAPLTFDLVDTWNRRSLGGCVYHVSHPGGLSHMNLPVNSYEAESRRLSRFFRIGHTPGEITPAPVTPSAERLFTLDLRRP